ncbi:unnamed protein product [Lactuca virosa]|uniref:PWWP domain-containing protein n=1 Tax=Lactuca virosa TaxID=75947 RepID=A0AAU9N056_9ASTR|nr:unnamed protein product [Lactuca virosa]
MLSSCQFPLAGNFHEQKKGQRRKETKSKESVSHAYDSMLSMLDDFAANGSVAIEVRSSMEGLGLGSPSHGYEVGDMVWGKVKSHPWWPGHVFNEEFATTFVRRSKREAVEEAMDEVSRRNALGLSCMCRSKQNFRKTDVKGYYVADVADYEPGAGIDYRTQFQLGNGGLLGASYIQCRLRGKIDSNGCISAFLEERLSMGLNFIISAEVTRIIGAGVH